VLAPLGLMVPFNVAAVCPMFVADVVVAVGGIAVVE
jgi:hypothetical protein